MFDRKEWRKKYYQQHKEQEKANNKKWYKDNIEKVKENHHNYYIKNKEKLLENNKIWQENNKEKYIKSISQSRKKRVEKLREQGVSNAWDVVNFGKKSKYKVKE